MNKNELVKNLKKNIQDIYAKIDEFEQTDQIHLIDIDLALSKVRNLYELLSKLNTSQAYQPSNQQEEISTITKQEKIKEEKEQSVEVEKQTNKPQKINEAVDIENITETPVQEPELIIETPTKKETIPTQQEDKIEQESNENTIHEETKIKQNGNSHGIVADKFQSKKFVHDGLANKNIKDVSSKMQSKPIKDINSAIGLNDKFIFIRELFNNNKDHYNETIQVLNNFDTFENAVSFLTENFDWDNEDPIFERLKELVRRKYSAK